ncbi:HlyC/CorC family transporter [Gluconacetobacter azotocaptans]|uniref:HlyC/CorC family transporter n=1 Tax=Gluconacetobacter azotocaptans TaxID=142834 RepID=A0A7W4JVR9_9PROT|nr:hemolysin family protein [Gluconacetobacter azotocaptans]MBB2191809.1 HlyC/CorC family transporter [Gluconacetobacter azotocaptans]MBM9403828.1 HlyC/CorC family transporter [Gluconacetobacter azotocaptans]GBQ29139.1 hemolysin/magnesium/cobalt transporter CorC/HlyC [Gluconacetobacter azotocaptans DSM 13594]
MIVPFLVILFLVILNGVFAMGELALISARPARLAVLQRKGVKGAERALRLAGDPQSFLPTVQVGITLVSILEGTFGGTRIEAYLTPWLARFVLLRPFAAELSMAVVVVAITSLMLVLGELVPKQLALRHPETIAARLSLPLEGLALLTRPVVWLLGHSSGLVLRLMGVGAMTREALTEEELKAYIAEGAQSGVLEQEERNMIERLLRLADRPVRAIMTPRNELFWIERRASREELRRILRTTAHTRIVVCDGGVDNPVGVILAKDMLDRMLDGKPVSIESGLRKPVVVPDTISAFDMVERMRSVSMGIALVLDEYGSFEGIVTASDLFAAIVGEHHEPGSTPKRLLMQEDVLILDGFMPADEVKDRLGLADLPQEGSYHTLGGLILALLRRVPAAGDKVVFSGWLFEVMETEQRRVVKVRASRQILAEN